MDISGPPDIVVVAGGDAPTDLEPPPPGALVVAADAGVATALAAGWRVDVAVGDFDSLAPELLDRLDDVAGEVLRHPADKDATDLELALAVARERPGRRCLVVGVEGGRPDHALANLLVASSPTFADLDVELLLAGGRAHVVHGPPAVPSPTTLRGRTTHGALVSLVPLHGAAVVSIAGVRWPLDHVELAPGTTRGVSNEVVADISLTVHDGTVLCVLPTPATIPPSEEP